MFNEFFYGSTGVDTDYQIERSLRFNSADSAYLSRTPSVAGNRKTWTWSGWVKLCGVGTNNASLFVSGVSGESTGIRILSSGYLNLSHDGAPIGRTDAILQDSSAWYHLIIAVDSTQATEADRIKMYINGVNQSLSISSCPLSLDTEINNPAYIHKIGAFYDNDPNYFLDGYMAEVNFIDGQALDASSFGKFDTNGIWQPIAYSGTYGTNGFHLDFSDNSSDAALGTDTSGNGNDWTPNNLVPSNIIVNTTVDSVPFQGSASAVLNADTTDFVRVATANYGNSYWTATFDPPIPITSSVKFYGYGEIGFVGFRARINDDPGTDTVAPSGFSLTTVDLNGATSLSKFDFRTFQGSQYGHNLYYIEVDGVIIVNGITLTTGDSFVDSPTNGAQVDTGVGGEVVGNYCTWNPLSKIYTGTTVFSNGNLDIAESSGAYRPYVGTVGVSGGKFYWEIVKTAGNTTDCGVGILPSSITTQITIYDSSVFLYRVTGEKSVFGSISSYGSSWAVNDVIGIALDMDAGQITFYKNGVSQGAITGVSTSTTWLPFCGDDSSATNTSWTGNFGQLPFAYAAPSGFKALCTANLPAPVVTKPSEYMDVVTYTGTAASKTITNLDFSPDFVWIKDRSAAYNHGLFDIVRGANKRLSSSTSASETTYTQSLMSFDSNGFTLGDNSDGNNTVNISGDAYVAWTWDAGDSTVTNTDGSITSQVRANPSAGFSIVTYTGNSTVGATVGHGLGVTPALIFTKGRTTGFNWRVWHESLGATTTDNLYLNATNSTTPIDSAGGNSDIGSNTIGFYVSGGPTWEAVNLTGQDYVSYCWAPIEGYSAFGSYTGNGSTDGPFVYTGFRPAFVIIKRTDAASLVGWYVWDSERDGYNVQNNSLNVNTTGTEYSATATISLLSNGFKLLDTYQDRNASNGTYIYAAVAETPFALNARAR